MNRSTTLAALTAAGLSIFAGTALGQNALGGGRALDGGLSNTPGGRVNAQVGDLQIIIRVNTNAGNALNGPGYIGTINNRGSAAFTNSTLANSGLLNRNFSPLGSSLGSASREQFDRIAVLEAGYLPSGSLTSTVSLPQGAGATDYRRGGDPYVGYVRDNQGGIIMARGSALRGLNLDPTSRLMATSASDAPRVGTAATYDRVIDDLRRASLARALEDPSRVDTSVTPKPIAATPTTPTPADSTTNPANPKSTATATPPKTGTTPGAPVQYDPEAALQRLRDRLAPKPAPSSAPASTTDRTRQPNVTTTTDPSNAAATAALTEEDINALRGMGLKLDALVPAGASDAQATDGYTRIGQESLAAGRYGLADEMFQAALSRSPGNPMAQAGRIHATMGLGLLMTAGIELRTYLVEHPEMIPVRFTGTLLLPQARAERLADMLTADIGRSDGSMLNNGGLTLAYLGRQHGNQAWLTAGFDAMAAQTKNDPQGTELLAILKKVWTEPAAPAK